MNSETDAKPFSDLLTAVAEFYDQTVSAARSTMFFGALNEYDFDVVVAAFNQYLQTDAAKYGFPKPIHIKEIIEGSEAERDANIWLALDEAIRKIGVWQSLVLADPFFAAAILRVWGTWVACCEYRANADDILWNSRRKDFVAAYRLAKKVGVSSAEPRLLFGYCDQQNRETGRFPKRTAMGAILLDGTVEARYVDIDIKTGLPASSLADVLALPSPKPRHLARLLAAGESFEVGEVHDLVAFDEIRPQLQEQIAHALRDRVFPDARPGGEADPDRERRAFLKAQADTIDAETRRGEQSDREATEHVRAPATAGAEQSDRTADSSGGTAEAGDGIPVREGARAELESGHGVADVEDSVRAGRRGVREHRERGNRRVHDAKRATDSARTGKHGQTRRKT
jgi:hypothetical protein